MDPILSPPHPSPPHSSPLYSLSSSPLLSSQPRDAELERTESLFISLVQSLLKDPTERAYFFQVFTARENLKLALFWTDDVHDISAGLVLFKKLYFQFILLLPTRV